MFFSANLLKLVQGGWFPLLVGLVMFTIMATWGRGWEMMLAEARVRAGHDAARAVPRVAAVAAAGARGWHGDLHDRRSARRAAFVAEQPVHNRVLHKNVVFLTVSSSEVPWIPASERVTVQSLGQGCFQVTIHYGFKDEVDLPAALEACAASGLTFDRTQISWFLSRATVVPTPGKGMAIWRERLFAVMLHNVGNVAAYLKLPADRVIELGARVEI